jgi:ATP-dependent DNA helicase RecG
LRDLGLLEQKGKSVGTFYVPTQRVVGTAAGTPAIAAQEQGSTPALSSQAQGLTPAFKAEAQGLDELPPAIAEAIRNLGERASLATIRHVVRDLCAWKPLKAEQIARYLGRQQVYVTRTQLTPMVRDGELEFVFPDSPAHPQQAYRATAGGKK